MPINCESFEKMIILSPGKWVCAICEPPQGASILNWPNYDLPKHIFFYHQKWLVEGPWEGKTSRRGLDQCLGEYLGVFLGFFWIGQNLIEPQSFAGPFLRLGSSPSGSKLSIHTLSQGLSVNDFGCTCLFYLGGLKVKVLKISNPSKSDWATKFRRAVIKVRDLCFWLKAVHPYTIPRFECQRPQLKSPFLPPKGQSQICRFWNRSK